MESSKRAPTVVPPRAAARAATKYTEDDNGCWISTYSVASHGYAQIGWQAEDGRTKGTTAHRAAWVHHNGQQIPAGMEVDHICFTKRCINPEHLRLATRKHNGEYRQGAQTNNRSAGLRGVTKNGSGWSASIMHHKRRIHLGTYPTPDEAAAVAAQARAGTFTFPDPTNEEN